jgi:hypothetical protein
MTVRVEVEQVRASARRWRVVARVQGQLRRKQSAAARFAQLEVLARSAKLLGWATTDPGEVTRVRARWARLHAIGAG